MDRRLSVVVKGEEKAWAFEFWGNPEFLEDWRKDGLEVYETCNAIPYWAAKLHLTKLWAFLQNIRLIP